jgi:hypothetical protein
VASNFGSLPGLPKVIRFTPLLVNAKEYVAE